MFSFKDLNDLYHENVAEAEPHDKWKSVDTSERKEELRD